MSFGLRVCVCGSGSGADDDDEDEDGGDNGDGDDDEDWGGGGGGGGGSGDVEVLSGGLAVEPHPLTDRTRARDKLIAQDRLMTTLLAFIRG